MKYSFLFLFIILIFPCFQAQELTDNFKYKAIYKLTWQIDSTDAESVQSETMLLFTGGASSRFSSEGQHIGDSIQSAYQEREKTPQSFREMRSKMPKTEFNYYIGKNVDSRKISYREKIIKDYYEYIEDLSNLEWDILTETKKIAGFKVQKAKTNYAGRHYTAWFTSEIPIPDRPYKFNGLPELIVKIADEKEFYVFELTGFKSLKNPIFNIENKEEYLKTDKSIFLEIKEEYNANPIGAMEQIGKRAKG
ncbi:GLPGLI family protein [Psychroflexus sp. MES1-P1E]|uniref:GLPGLI family protein n=1 Tax=Psychroflexus sp. MES1-P1E TaxID=2058320 RepID=UPI002155D7B2|nr:GLPGLI family protein [Psychroflexus sp. MES1-P1E]